MTVRVLLSLAFLIGASVTAASQPAGKLREYYDQEFKFGFKYPANWERVVTKNPIALETYIQVVVLSPPTRMNRGQLFEASVSVDVSKGSVSEKACIEFNEPPLTDGSQKPNRVQVASLTFHKVSDVVTNEGTREQTDVYRTFHSGRCYDVVMSIQRKDVKVMDQNVKMVNDGVHSILRTLYFGAIKQR